MCCIKLVGLKITRGGRKLLKAIPSILSYFFLVVSMLICIILLVPQCVDRVPVVSYFLSEHEFPMSYELHGEVNIYEDGELVDGNVWVYVGGYQINTSTSEPFTLSFVSPASKSFSVVIRYVIDGKTFDYTQIVYPKSGTHIVEREFVIHA
mgnify:CR=1 FL=1